MAVEKFKLKNGKTVFKKKPFGKTLRDVITKGLNPTVQENQQQSSDDEVVDTTRKKRKFGIKLKKENVVVNVQTQQSMEEIVESPLGRFHLSAHIRKHKPELLKLLQFRTSFKNMTAEMERGNYKEAYAMQKSIYDDFLNTDGNFSLDNFFELQNDVVQDGVDLKEINDKALEKLQNDIYDDFITSIEHQKLITRIHELQQHQTIREQRQDALSSREAGYLKRSDSQVTGTIEVKKYGGLAKRPRWKLRHAVVEGSCLYVYSDVNQIHVTEATKGVKRHVLPLVHARITEYHDVQRPHCIRVDTFAWARQQAIYGECKSWFISTASGESLSSWRKQLEKSIEQATRTFKDKNEENHRFILSYKQLQKAVAAEFTQFLAEDQSHPRHKPRQTLKSVASMIMERNKINMVPVKKKSSASSRFMTLASKIFRAPVDKIRRYFFICRAFLFLTCGYLIGWYSLSAAWPLALSGIWAYNDHLLGHELVMANYPTTIGVMLLIYAIGVVYPYSWSGLIVIPISIFVGYNELTNQRWASVRREMKKTCTPSYETENNNYKRGHATLNDLEWVNMILERSWGNLKRATEDTIRYYSMMVLDENLPSFLSRVELSKLEFGRPPQITGVQVHSNAFSTNSNVVVLDIDVVWHDTPDIVLRAVTKAAVRADVALMELEVCGTLRLEFMLDDWENNIPLWPCFSALSYGFTKRPDINFRMRAMKLDVMNLPLLSDWLDNLISSLIATNFTYPNCLTYPDWRCKATQVPISSRSRLPAAILVVKVLQCKGINRTDRFSNLFCELEVDGEYRKQSVRTQTTTDVVVGLSPSWNETFFFLIDDPLAQSLSVKVNNVKTIGKDDVLCNTLMSVKDFPNRLNSTTFKKLPLIDKCKGQLLLEIGWKSIAPPKPLPLSDLTHLAPGILVVKLISGVNLGGPTGPRGFPYVNLSMSQRGKSILGEARSQIAKNQVNPRWDETFYFVIDSPLNEILLAEILCQNGHRDESVGQLEINIKDICSAPDGQIWQIPLTEQSTGSLSLRFIWREFT